MDFEALQAAGIADARRRAELIEYLHGLGFTAEQMVNAERRGRLFGLAGDILQFSGPPIHSLASAADELGLPVAEVERAWALLGLTVADLHTPVLTQADVDGLATWVAMRARLGDDAASGWLRVLGAVLARLAEAESAMMRAGQPDLWISHTADELTTAQAWRATAEFIPRIGALIDAAHRHHLVSAGAYFEGVLPAPSVGVVCGVGFSDLSGFTALTQQLTTTELTVLLSTFAATVTDIVHAHGGRLVKFIGDAAMWVSPTAQLLAATAAELVHHPKAREAGLRIRAGLGFGEVLAIAGDYFGTPVNLAARLVAAAAPGQILAAATVRDELADWPATQQDPLPLKGFDSPVTAYELQPAGTG